MGALAGAGVWVIRMGVSNKRGRSGTRSGEDGMPDLHMPGLGWFEVKLPGEELGAKQCEWHAKAARHGVRVATVRSVLEALTLAKLWQIESGKTDSMKLLAAGPRLTVVR